MISWFILRLVTKTRYITDLSASQCHYKHATGYVTFTKILIIVFLMKKTSLLSVGSNDTDPGIFDLNQKQESSIISKQFLNKTKNYKNIRQSNYEWRHNIYIYLNLGNRHGGYVDARLGHFDSHLLPH